jgi:hypothetical protein
MAGRSRAAAAVLTSLIVLLSSLSCGHESVDGGGLRTDDRFVKETLAPTLKLYQFGVADVDGDGWLDIQTKNHHARPAILVNRRDGSFTDEVLSLNLGTVQGFIGADPSATEWEPVFDRPGLYIYWQLAAVVIRTHRIPESKPASGIMLVGRDEVVEATAGAMIREGTVDAAAVQLPARYLVNVDRAIAFTSAGDGTVTIRTRRNYHYALRLAISDSLPLDAIFVGSSGANPASRNFVVRLDDRHAMAWFDVDGDALVDVVASNGGQGGRVQGRVEEGTGSYRVFLQRAGRFEEAFPYSELSSYGCATRQLSLADYDTDGDLDLYVVCGRGEQAHQLFERTADGRFEEVAAARRLAANGAGLITWLDVDGDADLDLFHAGKRKAWLYRNSAGHFEAEFVGALGDNVRQISKADYDGDGDVDLYLAAGNGSQLLIGERGGLRTVEPGRFGLPREAVCGSWLDFNNDGMQDLHVLPGGIFEQHADGHFSPTGLLASTEPADFAGCTWFDANNDGARDLLVATPRFAAGAFRGIRDKILRRLGKHYYVPPVWDLTLYRAVKSTGHWLEVRLIGPQGNRPAIGSSVRVRTVSATQVQGVGHAEDSPSSGHYRAYFGLGDEVLVESVEVIWADGSLQKIERVHSDQLLTIEKQERPDS